MFLKIWISETGWAAVKILQSYQHGGSGSCGADLIPASIANDNERVLHELAVERGANAAIRNGDLVAQSRLHGWSRGRYLPVQRQQRHLHAQRYLLWYRRRQHRSAAADIRQHGTAPLRRQRALGAQQCLAKDAGPVATAVGVGNEI